MGDVDLSPLMTRQMSLQGNSQETPIVRGSKIY